MSLVINKGSIDRGLFNGCKFTFYKTELEQREEFANPDITTTIDIKSACYDKLVNGIIKKGTIVNKSDAIIGKILKITKNADEAYQYADRSVIYKDEEPAIVHNVIIDRNEDDERFCKVILRKLRPVSIGDKFSVIGTSQVLTDKGWKEIQNLDIENDKVATMTLEGNLDYVYPSGLSTYDYEGKMYSLKTQQLEMFVTSNHKLYVKRRDKNYYELLKTSDVFNRRVRFKKWVENNYLDIEFFNAKDSEGNIVQYPMDAYLKLVGMFISDGYVCDDNRIQLCAVKQRKKDFNKQIYEELGVEYIMCKDRSYISGTKYPALLNEFEKLNKGALHKTLPNFVWTLSMRQARILLNSLIEGDGSYNKQGSAGYYTSSSKLANDVCRLALHAGWSGTVKKFSNPEKQAGGQSIIVENGVERIITTNADCLYVRIVKTKNEPQINHGHVKEQNAQEEKYVHYKGLVYCLEIPDTHQHVYYSRETTYSPPCWTGNSSRAG